MVVLLVFAIMALTMISAAVNIMFITTQAISQEELSRTALSLAETGTEEALLRLLRNPTYTGSSTMNVGDDTVSIVVANGGSVKTITASTTVGAVSKAIRLSADYGTTVLTLGAWSVLY